MINKFLLGRLYKPKKFINSITKSKTKCFTILTYHEIQDKYFDNFRLQIEWLKTNYKLITPQELIGFLDGSVKINEHSVLITFDDGFLSSYIATQNILNVLDIKAFFFIPSMFVTETQNNWRKTISNNFFSGSLDLETISNSFKPITTTQIQTLINQGHKIGGHTHTHCNLSKVSSNKELLKEILNPKKIFNDELKIKLDTFAFPNGRFNHINESSLMKIASNYTFGFSNIRGSNNSMTSRYAIKRQTVSPEMPINYLGLILEGGFDFYWRNNSKKLDRLAKILDAK